MSAFTQRLELQQSVPERPASWCNAITGMAEDDDVFRCDNDYTSICVCGEKLCATHRPIHHCIRGGTL